jgi:protein MpaA
MKHFSFIKDFIIQISQLFKKSLLFKSVIVAIFCLIIITVIGQIIIGKQLIVFSFASQETCINSLTLLPNMHKQHSVGYVLKKTGLVTIAKYPVLSKKICILASATPIENHNTQTSISLYGNPLIKRNFLISVPEYPKAVDALPIKSFVSVAQPLDFKLSKADSVFGYELLANGLKASCIKKDPINITCDTASLNLKHANTYNFKISRTFNGRGVSTIAEAKIPTITAVNIISSSINNGQTVYDRPTNFEFTIDKPIAKLGKVSLAIVKDSKSQNIQIGTKYADQKVTINLDTALLRGENYKLYIEDVISTDGGSLAKPLAFTFYTSKGPAVSKTNIRDRSTLQNQTITLDFDQVLNTSQNFEKYVSLLVNGKPHPTNIISTNNRVLLSATNLLPKCTKFTVNVVAGITSQYGIVSESGWSFNSRTSCYDLQTIGSSISGRPIYAYRFGSSQEVIMYTANLHGDEANTKYLMDKWVDEIEGNPEKIPVNRSIIVISSINPDGFATKSRLNASGIDLNRNFPANNWKSGVVLPSGQFAPSGGGVKALSEPESNALASFITTLNPKLVLSFHSKGPVVVGNDSGTANSLASIYASKSGYPFRTNANIGNFFNYDTTGAYEDWLHDKLDKPAILIELSSRNSDEFSRNRTALWLMAQSL